MSAHVETFSEKNLISPDSISFWAEQLATTLGRKTCTIADFEDDSVFPNFTNDQTLLPPNPSPKMGGIRHNTPDDVPQDTNTHSLHLCFNGYAIHLYTNNDPKIAISGNIVWIQPEAKSDQFIIISTTA